MAKAEILVVEDEVLVAEDLEKVVTDLGYEVLGRAENVMRYTVIKTRRSG